MDMLHRVVHGSFTVLATWGSKSAVVSQINALNKGIQTIDCPTCAESCPRLPFVALPTAHHTGLVLTPAWRFPRRSPPIGSPTCWA